MVAYNHRTTGGSGKGEIREVGGALNEGVSVEEADRSHLARATERLATRDLVTNYDRPNGTGLNFSSTKPEDIPVPAKGAPVEEFREYSKNLKNARIAHGNVKYPAYPSEAIPAAALDAENKLANRITGKKRYITK